MATGILVGVDVGGAEGPQPNSKITIVISRTSRVLKNPFLAPKRSLAQIQNKLVC
ncbi:MAG: hypothetical protein V1724_09640 [Chloroflexota bacterium]